MKKLSYKSEDSLQNLIDINMRGRGGLAGGEGEGLKNKRAIEIALASRLCDHSKLKI
jgi:hypothetical protein